MSQIYTLFLLLSSLLIACTIGAPPKQQQNSVSAFMISHDSRDKVTVQLEGEAIFATCRLDYDTSLEAKKEQKIEYLPATTVIEQMTKKYGCLPYNHGIFTYEICLGERVAQRADNGDVYTLGVYDAHADSSLHTQSYIKGTFCEAAHTDRKTIVEFVCADKVQVQQITEPAVCQYKITLGVPEVCGHPEFTASTSQVEAWVLEISETDEGSVICQAYNNGLYAMGTLTFSTFSLTVTSADYTLVKSIVRNDNRKITDKKAVQEVESPPGVFLRSKQQVDYAKIVVK